MIDLIKYGFVLNENIYSRKVDNKIYQISKVRQYFGYIWEEYYQIDNSYKYFLNRYTLTEEDSVKNLKELFGRKFKIKNILDENLY